MKRKKRTAMVPILAAGILLCLVAAFLLPNPMMLRNRYGLREQIRSAEGETVVLHQLTPFAWDAVYTFSPYTSKDEIAHTIGFRSSSIQETVSEGMTQLLFVEEDQVVCSVCAYPKSAGYGVSDLPQNRAIYNEAESPRFRVERRGEILWLQYLD